MAIEAVTERSGYSGTGNVFADLAFATPPSVKRNCAWRMR